MIGEQRRLDFELVLDAMRHRWRVWLLPMVLVPALAVSWRIIRGPKVKAAAQVLVQEGQRANPVLKDLLGDLKLSGRLPEIASIVRSRDTVEQVLRELGVVKEGMPEIEIDAQVEAFRSQIEVYGEGGGLVRITVVGRDVSKVYEGLRLLTAALIAEMTKPQRRALTETVEFLEQQLTRVKQELGDIEKRLADHAGQNANYLPELRKLKLANHERLTNSLLAAETELVESERARELAESRMKGFAPERRKLADRAAAARRRLVELQKTYTKQHPQVKAAMADAEAADAALDRAGGPLIGGATTKSYGDIVGEAEANRDKVDFLQKRVAESLAELQSFGQYEQELDRLRRAIEAKSNVYGSLLERYEDSVVSRALVEGNQSADIRVIEAPSRPQPTGRDGLLFILALTIAGGFVLGATLVLVLEATDPTVRTMADAEALTNAPTIGILPG